MLQHLRPFSLLFLVLLSGCNLSNLESGEQTNRAPNAEFTFEQIENTLDVAFSASASSDPEGGALTYNWDFGDGRSADSRDYKKTYRNAGDKQVTLTVNDPDGQTDSVTKTVTVQPVNGGDTTNQPPTVAIVGANPRVSNIPLNQLRAEASDPDGDELTYSWKVESENEGLVELGTPTEYATSVLFYGLDKFVFSLTVSDGKGGTASDTVDFFADPSGEDESVTAEIEGEPRKTAKVGEPLELTATVENFGEAILDYSWHVVYVESASGDFGSVILNPQAQSLATLATFAEAGRYVIQIRASNIATGSLAASDIVAVTVE